jgi:hypothetical protein
MGVLPLGTANDFATGCTIPPKRVQPCSTRLKLQGCMSLSSRRGSGCIPDRAGAGLRTLEVSAGRLNSIGRKSSINWHNNTCYKF